MLAALDRHVDQLADRFARIIAPAPPPRAMTAFVRTLRPGEGRNREEARRVINPRSHAPQWYVLNAFEGKPRRYRTYLTIGPTGDGKSLCTINMPIMHALFEQGDDVVYAGPTRQLLNKLYRTKLRRLMTASDYGHLLPKEGPGSSGGVADDMIFNNGSRLFPMGGGGKGESAQAGVHARWAFYEEYDDMEDDEVTLVEQRTSAHGLEHQLVKTTTLKKDRGSRTIAEYQETTRSRVQYCCARCGCWQLFTVAQLEADTWLDVKQAVATVRLRCSECKQPMTPLEHLEMLERHRQVSLGDDGAPTPEIRDVDQYGMWWGSLDSSRKGLQYLAVKYATAMIARERHFNHEPMRRFFRDELALPYLDEDVGVRDGITDEKLREISRASGYKRAEIPREATRLFFGQDCQLRSHYWLALATEWIPDKRLVRWWIVDWGEISVCGAADQPTVDQRHGTLDQVDRIAERGYQVKDSEQQMVAAPGSSAVDTAYHPREVRPWVARHRHRWLSMRGCGRDQFARMTEPRRGELVQSVKGAVIVYEQADAPDRLQGFAEASSLNDAIEAALHGGDGWLPEDADNKLAFHLLGIRRGGPDDKEPWVEVHRRHDWRDCLVYALARAYQFYNHPRLPTRQFGIVGNIR